MSHRHYSEAQAGVRRLFDEPGADPMRQIDDALRRADRLLRELADEVSVVTGTRWSCSGLCVELDDAHPLACAALGRVEGAPSDGETVVFEVWFSPHDGFLFPAPPPGHWKVLLVLSVGLADPEPNEGRLTAYAETTEFDDPVRAATGLVAAVETLRALAGRREPTAAAWRAATE